MTLTLHSGFQVALYPPGATFGPRTLHDWEMVWLIEGDALYEWNGQTVPAPEGALVLCRPGIDGFRWDPRRPTRHAYFHFALNGDAPHEWLDIEQWPLVRASEGREDAGDLPRTLFRHLLAWNGSGDPAQTEWLALSLLAAFVTGQGRAGEVNRSSLPDTVQRATDYIARRLDEQPAPALTLDEIAQAACVSPEHLCRVFKAATGRAPLETVRLARLDRGMSLLARTNFSVGEIAHLVGFQSPFHFTRRFSQVYGVSPREVRQRIARGEAPPLTPLLQRL